MDILTKPTGLVLVRIVLLPQLATAIKKFPSLRVALPMKMTLDGQIRVQSLPKEAKVKRHFLN